MSSSARRPAQKHVYRSPRRRRRRGGWGCLLAFTGPFWFLAGLFCCRLFSAAAPVTLLPPSSPSLFAPAVLLPVEYLGQGDWPTGCESVTAVMALNHAGVEMDVDTFIDSHLPRGQYYTQGGRAYGDDPNFCFVGDPRSSSGFGCYAPALFTALESAAPGLAHDLSGLPLSSLCSGYLDEGVPVILWATINMEEPYPGRSWQLPSGETFTWTAREHCLLLVGYDEESYYFNDPYKDKGLVSYEKSLVETRYSQLGCQALALFP